jgi:hypothetical protein
MLLHTISIDKINLDTSTIALMRAANGAQIEERTDLPERTVLRDTSTINIADRTPL